MSEWQPIETAPKDGTQFQAWVTGWREDGWWEPNCRFNADGRFEVWQRVDYDDDGYDSFDGIATHWMPPPEPPKA